MLRQLVNTHKNEFFLELKYVDSFESYVNPKMSLEYKKMLKTGKSHARLQHYL